MAFHLLPVPGLFPAYSILVGVPSAEGLHRRADLYAPFCVRPIAADLRWANRKVARAGFEPASLGTQCPVLDDCAAE